MAEGERDNTNEWVLPDEARPATLAQLEQRIEYAVAVARASEAAALEIGAVALDAAEQARRAAELAERASADRGAAAVEVSEAVPPAAGEDAATGERESVGMARVEAQEPEADATRDEAAEAKSKPGAEHDSFKAFLERADRISARLEAIAPPR